MMDSIECRGMANCAANLEFFEYLCSGQACLGAALHLQRCPVQREHLLSMNRRSQNIPHGKDAINTDRFQSGG